MGFSRQEYWSGVPLLSLTTLYAICQYDGLSTLKFLAKKKKVYKQNNSQFVGEETEKENS